MKPRTKRIFRWLAAVAIVVIALLALAYARLRQAPAFYKANTLSAAEREAAATSVEQKLVIVQNAAAQARADEYAARHQSTTLPAPQPITLTVTQDELNSFFEKWSVWESVRDAYSKYLQEPYIALEDGQVILAGKVPSMDTIVSAHFTPGMDADGRLHLTLSRVLAGRLPFPVAAFSGYRQQAVELVSHRMAGWRARADVNKTGVANAAMIDAVMGQLLISSLSDESADPVLFLPLVQHGSIPVRVLNADVADHALTLTVEPMSPAQRQSLISSVRQNTAFPQQ